MKVLHLTEHFLPFLGGVEINLYEMCRRLVKIGFDVEVVCELEKGTPKHEVFDGIKVHRILGFELIKLIYSLGRITPSMMWNAIRTEADVVHAHSYGFFPTWVSMLSSKPTVITTHSDPTAQIYPLCDMFRAIPVKSCDRVIATTVMERNRLIKIGVSPSRVAVIPNGVTHPPPEAPSIDFSPMILCLARLDIAHKGQDVLLHAIPKVVSAVPNVKLFVIGGGRDREKLERITRSLGITRYVIFKGQISPSKKGMYLKNCDVLCVTPRTESFGTVYLEAMAYGRSIVTTNVGGIPEVVGDCAIMLPPNNSEILANKLIEVLTNKKLRDELGRRGLQRVKDFDWDVLVKKYEALYEELA